MIIYYFRLFFPVNSLRVEIESCAYIAVDTTP